MVAREMRHHSVTFSDDDSAVFHALADPTRRHILAMVAEGARAVREIAAVFSISRPAVSKHLSVLRHAGLIVERVSGRERLQEIELGPLRGAMVRLEQLASAVPAVSSEADPGPEEKTWRCW